MTCDTLLSIVLKPPDNITKRDSIRLREPNISHDACSQSRTFSPMRWLPYTEGGAEIKAHTKVESNNQTVVDGLKVVDYRALAKVGVTGCMKACSPLIKT